VCRTACGGCVDCVAVISASRKDPCRLLCSTKPPSFPTLGHPAGPLTYPHPLTHPPTHPPTYTHITTRPPLPLPHTALPLTLQPGLVPRPHCKHHSSTAPSHSPHRPSPPPHLRLATPTQPPTTHSPSMKDAPAASAPAMGRSVPRVPVEKWDSVRMARQRSSAAPLPRAMPVPLELRDSTCGGRWGGEGERRGAGMVHVALSDSTCVCEGRRLVSKACSGYSVCGWSVFGDDLDISQQGT
jgi:hypothetical protein